MKYIHFGIGGGLYVYYVGIAQALYELVDHEVLKTYKQGGTSAGICGAMALYFSLYHEHMTPILFFQKYIKPLIIDEAKKYTTGLYLNGGKIAKEATVAVYRDLYEPIVTPKHMLYSVVTELPYFNIKKVDRFDSEHKFAMYVSSTMCVPVVFHSDLWNEIDGQRLVDGGFTWHRHEICEADEDEAIYFNIEVSDLNDKRYKCVNVFEWVHYNPKYLLCPSDANHDSLFQKGYDRAMEHKDEILALFN